MPDYDPDRLDPNRQDPRTAPRNENFDRGSRMNWSWVLGAAVVIVLLLIGMSLMSNNDRTAEGVAPSNETTGQSAPPPEPATVPAEKMSPRPASPNQ